MRISDWSSDVCSSDLHSRFTTCIRKDQKREWVNIQHGTNIFNFIQCWAFQPSLQRDEVSPAGHIRERLLAQTTRLSDPPQCIGQRWLERCHYELYPKSRLTTCRAPSGYTQACAFL